MATIIFKNPKYGDPLGPMLAILLDRASSGTAQSPVLTDYDGPSDWCLLQPPFEIPLGLTELLQIKSENEFSRINELVIRIDGEAEPIYIVNWDYGVTYLVYPQVVADTEVALRLTGAVRSAGCGWVVQSAKRFETGADLDEFDPLLWTEPPLPGTPE